MQALPSFQAVNFYFFLLGVGGGVGWGAVLLPWPPWRGTSPLRPLSVSSWALLGSCCRLVNYKFEVKKETSEE